MVVGASFEEAVFKLHFGIAQSRADAEELQTSTLSCDSILHRSLAARGVGRGHLVLLNI